MQHTVLVSISEKYEVLIESNIQGGDQILELHVLPKGKLCGAVVWVLGFRAKVPGSIPAAATKFLGSLLLMGVCARGLKFAQP